MVRLGLRAALLFALCVAPARAAARQSVPHPRDVLGFTPGDDYQLADFSQLEKYFHALADASPRVRLSSAGKSEGGRDMLVAVVSSEANLERLDRYREIARTLAHGRGLTDEQARALAREGKTIVWIDSGLHAAESAHAQHAILLGWRVATEESDEMRRIRDDVILVLLPCINPDGLDLVADWYRRTVHTLFQDSPMPWLFNRYSGYDNNRDGFMQNDAETRVISRLLYYDWLPQIVYNHHQGFYPTRIFVPPFPDPFNPNIDRQVIREIELIGAAMQNRFEREGKDGVISRYGFSTWYNGALRTTTYFHNMIGILTETTHDSPSPMTYDPADFPDRFGNGWSTRESSTGYPRPWKGGTLHFADAVDYMMTGSLAVLDAAARFREEIQYGMWQKASRQIALGKSEPPIAYAIPPAQRDPPVVAKFIEVLMRGGVEVQRADAAFTADGRAYPAGTHVILLAQPNRPFVKDLLEPQRYPDDRLYPGGPPVQPYDNAGWTLSYQMGVDAIPVRARFDAALSPVREHPRVRGTLNGDGEWGVAIDPRRNDAVTAAFALMRRGVRVSRATAAIAAGGETLPAGAFIARGADAAAATGRLADSLGLAAHRLPSAPASALVPLRVPRVGVYASWAVEWVDDWTAAEGWTRFVLDGSGIRYTTLRNADVRAGGLRRRFDVIVVPNQDAGDILHGYHEGRRQFGSEHQALPPPEYQGGIEQDGLAALKRFVEEGGTLILIDRTSDLAIDGLDLPVRNVLAGVPPDRFFGPGSIVAISVNGTNAVGYGMPGEALAYFRKGRAFDFDDPSVSSIARYAEHDILRSGWLLGDELMAGKHAAVEARLGEGRVIMFGIVPYFRGQPHATFKLFLNSFIEAH